MGQNSFVSRGLLVEKNCEWKRGLEWQCSSVSVELFEKVVDKGGQIAWNILEISFQW